MKQLQKYAKQFLKLPKVIDEIQCLGHLKSEISGLGWPENYAIFLTTVDTSEPLTDCYFWILNLFLGQVLLFKVDNSCPRIGHF